MVIKSELKVIQMAKSFVKTLKLNRNFSPLSPAKIKELSIERLDCS